MVLNCIYIANIKIIASTHAAASKCYVKINSKSQLVFAFGEKDILRAFENIC